MNRPQRAKSWLPGGRPSSRRGPKAKRPNLELLEGRALLAGVGATVAQFPIRADGGAVVGITSGFGNDPNLYFTATNVTNTDTSSNIGVYNPKTGTGNVGQAAQFPIPALNVTVGDLAAGADGNVYFLETTATGVGQIGVFKPSAGKVIAEYPILSGLNLGLQSITLGPDHKIWFTEENTNKVGVFDPATHSVAEITSPTPLSQPFGITTDPADGSLWYTEFGKNKLGRIDPVTHLVQDFLVNTGSLNLGSVAYNAVTGNLDFLETQAKQVGSFNPTTRKRVAEVPGLADSSPADHIAVDASGNDWFTQAGQSVGELVQATGVLNPNAVATGPGSVPTGLTLNPDGNFYYALSTSSNVGSFTPAGVRNPNITVAFTQASTPFSPGAMFTDPNTGLIFFGQAQDQFGVFDPATKFTTEYLAATPNGFALDALNGHTVYFTQTQPKNPDEIGSIDTATRKITETPVPVGGGSAGIAYDAQNGGYFWFAETTANKLAYFDPVVKNFNESVAVPASESGPSGVAVDASGDLWVTMSGSGTVDAYNPGTNKWLPAPVVLPGGANSNPRGITLGPDGNMWVTEVNAGRVAVINPANGAVVTEVNAPATGAVTVGPGDGNVWITEAASVASIRPGTYAVTSYAAPNASPRGLASGKDGNLYFSGAGPRNFSHYIGAVTVAAASQPASLAFTTPPPPGVTVGNGFGLVVAVENPSGQVDTFENPANGSVTLSLAGGPAGGNLGGTLVAPVVNGLAVFSGLTVDTAGPGYTIQASFAGLPSVTTPAFAATNAATRLAVSAPQANIRANQTFTFTVSAEDAGGNVDTSYSGPITITTASDPGNAALGGTLTLGATNGVATFADLTISKPGVGYSLQASSPVGNLSPVTTAAFNVSAAPATRLVFNPAPPLTVTAGSPFGFTVDAEDASGFTDPTYNGVATVALQNNAGGPLAGTLTANVVNGVATFSGLSLTAAGSKTLIVSSGTLTPATTTSLTVVGGVATNLAVSTVPVSPVVAGSGLAVLVSARDVYGNAATGYTGTVRLTGAAAGLLVPTASYTFTAADKGVHTFNVTPDVAGTLTLSAADTGNASLSATSVVTVTAGATTEFVLTPAGPLSTMPGAPLTVTLSAADQFGNATPGYTGTVTVASTDGAAVLPSGYQFAAADNGTHAFTVTLNTAGSQSLVFTDAANALKLTAPVGVAALVPKITLTSNAANPVYGKAMTFSVTVGPAAGSLLNPTGGVQFLVDGKNFIPTVALVNGAATSLSTSTLAAGPHSITVAYLGDSHYAATPSAPVTINVAPATLTVTPLNVSVVAGQPIPLLYQRTFSGFVNNETPSIVTGSPTLSTTATASSGPGRYAIDAAVGTLAAPNYVIVPSPGVLTVTGYPARSTSADFVVQADGQVYNRPLGVNGTPTGAYQLTSYGQVKGVSVSRIGGGAGFEAFVVGEDNQLYAATVSPAGTTVRTYFKAAYGSIASVSSGTDASGNPVLFAVGTDNQLYEQTFNAQGTAASGSYIKAASGDFKQTFAANDAAGNPLLYAIGQDNQVYGLKMSPSGVPTGGLFKVFNGPVSQLAVGHDAANNPELFAVGAGGGSFAQKLDANGSPTGGRLALGGVVASISVTNDAANNPLLFAVGTDGQVYGHKFDAAGTPLDAFFKVGPVPGVGGALSVYAGTGVGNAAALFAVSAADGQVYAAPFSPTGDPTGPFALTTAGQAKKVVIS